MFHTGAGAVWRRSFLGAGAAAVSVAALLAPPVTPHPAQVVDPAIRLTAAAPPFDLLDPAAGPTSIGDAIIGFYLSIEPWTQYGASVASWAAGWVPFLGLLAPQITFFYDLDESIVRSLVFNTAYLVDGTVDFDQAMTNISDATTNAFNAFVNTETSWLHGLLPPPPPAFADLSTLVDVGGLPDPGATDLLSLVG